MTPAEKRKRTIIERYGSYKKMLAKRDPSDLILGGYNGGLAKTEKGFSKWEEGKLSSFAKKRKRDANGRFLPKEVLQPDEHRGEETTGTSERPKR